MLFRSKQYITCFYPFHFIFKWKNKCFFFSTKQNLASGPFFFSFNFPTLPEKITALLQKNYPAFHSPLLEKNVDVKPLKPELGPQLSPSSWPLKHRFLDHLWRDEGLLSAELSDCQAEQKRAQTLFFLRMKWNTHQPGRLVHWKIPVLSRLTNKSSSYVNTARDAIYLFICLKGGKKKRLVCRLLAKCMSSGGGKEKSTTKEFKDKILRTPNWVKIAFWQIPPIANETEIQVIL